MKLERVCKFLGELGVASKEVINALLERLNDKEENEEVKKASKTALKQIAEKHPELREKNRTIKKRKGFVKIGKIIRALKPL